jgi:lipid-A-disaccharide synthase
MTPRRLALVAGEASGDLLAAHLIAALKARWPALQTVGIGGPRMAQQGFDAWWPHSKLAVRGYVEVLRHYREIVGIRQQLGDRLLADPPDLFIGVDAPDFNLDLERRLKEHGVATVHFISPSIWAWRPKRIDKIRAAVDHMLCVFPFESRIYADAGVAASYVGHPLADVVPLEPPRAAARAALGLADDTTVLALLPGSRGSEVEQHTRVFAEAALGVQAQRPALRIVLPVAPGLRAAVDAQLRRLGSAASSVQLLDGRSHEALAACDVAIVASGTATLEAALFKRPMVIAYRMNALSWQLMKRQRLQPWVGLPNILLERLAVPERLQGEASAQALANDVLAWLNDPAAVAQLQKDFSELHQGLRRDTAALAVEAIDSLLQARAAQPAAVLR